MSGKLKKSATTEEFLTFHEKLRNGFNIEKRASISDVSSNIERLQQLKVNAARKISNAYIDFQQMQASLSYPHSQEVGTQEQVLTKVHSKKEQISNKQGAIKSQNLLGNYDELVSRHEKEGQRLAKTNDKDLCRVVNHMDSRYMTEIPDLSDKEEVQNFLSMEQLALEFTQLEDENLDAWLKA